MYVSQMHNVFDALPFLSFLFNICYIFHSLVFTLLQIIQFPLSSPFFAACNVRFMFFSLFSPDPCVTLQIREHT